MVKEGNLVTRSCALEKPTELGLNVTADTRQGRKLRSSARQDRGCATEPVEVGTRHNNAISTGSTTTLKRHIGCVKLTDVSESQRTVAAGVTTAP